MIEATCQTRDFNIKATKNKNRSLKHILITKEILYMKGFDDRLGLILSFLIQEREGFVEQLAADKIRDVARQIEQLVDEISFRWEILFPVTCNSFSCFQYPSADQPGPPGRGEARPGVIQVLLHCGLKSYCRAS